MPTLALACLFALSFGTRVVAQESAEPSRIPEPDTGDIQPSPAGPDAPTGPEAPPSPDGGTPAPEPPGPPLPPPPVPLAPPPAAPPPSPETSAPPARKAKAEKPAESSAAPEGEEEELTEVAPRPSAKGDPFGDEPDNGPKSHGFTFRFLLQTRYTRVFDDPDIKDAQTNDGFALNRVFLRGTVRPYKWLSAKLLVDFAELAYSNPQQALKLAYGEIKPMKRLELTVGLFKRTFSLLELLPIAEFEFADTGPTDSLIKLTQFGGRDVGVMVRGDLLPKRRWLHAYLGAFGGPGEGAEPAPGLNGSPNTGPDLAAPSLLLTARLQSRPVKHLSLGVDGAWRPAGTAGIADLPPRTQVTSGVATSADATYSNQVLELRGEWLYGDRTDINTRGEARTFMAAWGILAVRFPVSRIVAVPALRFEWLDADRQHPSRENYLATAAFNLDFTAQVRLLLDLSRDQLRAGTSPSSSPPGVFSRSATFFVAQVQLRI